jgi:hypothetical protein
MVAIQPEAELMMNKSRSAFVSLIPIGRSRHRRSDTWKNPTRT